MNIDGPTLVQSIDNNFLLWFKNSNQYLFLGQATYTLLDHFLQSKNQGSFKNKLIAEGIPESKIEALYHDIDSLLQTVQEIKEPDGIINSPFNNKYRDITKYYQIGDHVIEVHFSSEDIVQLVHPQLSHLEIEANKTSANDIFDIYLDSDHYYIFKNEQCIGVYPLANYYLLQGKFSMHVLCSVHNNTEADWIGTFHASTISINNEAIMLIGDSGKGKSTFTALMMAQGYKMLSDDLTPIMNTDKKLYPYPGAISIKSGAFKVLSEQIPDFKNLPEYYINPYKGYVKYIKPDKNNSINFLKGLPCKTFIKINYQQDAATRLESIPLSEALNILIPESWLSPIERNAKGFMDWIKTVTCYQLTYSNAEEAINEISKQFGSASIS